MPVLLTNEKGDEKEATVEQLMPGAFSIQDLKIVEKNHSTNINCGMVFLYLNVECNILFIFRS